MLIASIIASNIPYVVHGALIVRGEGTLHVMSEDVVVDVDVLTAGVMNEGPSTIERPNREFAS